MTSPTGVSKYERDWLGTVDSAIRAGLERELVAALDEAKDNNQIGARPLTQVIGMIIHAKHNKPPNKKREALMRIAIDHPAMIFPKSDYHSGFITSAIEKKQFGLLPLLHQAGFKLLVNSRAQELMVKQLSEGRWPYPDLFMPNLLADLENPWALLRDFYTEACMKPDFIKKLVSLGAPSETLRKTMSRSVARSKTKILAIHEKYPERVVECLRLLADGTLLDWGIMRAEETHDQGVEDCRWPGLIAHAQSQQLSNSLPQATSKPQRRSL